MSEKRHKLDDAAAAALFSLTRKPREHVGVLYQGEDGIERTPAVTQHEYGKASGRFQIPAGSLQGLFHNHPRSSFHAEDFSATDKQQATKLGVPSYISAGDRIRRFDPITNTTEDVLAEFPIEEWKAYIASKYKIAGAR